MNSDFLKLNLSDVIKGCIVSVITAILTALLPLLQSGQIPEYKTLLFAGLTAGVSYLLKNLFTSSTGDFLKKETNF